MDAAKASPRQREWADAAEAEWLLSAHRAAVAKMQRELFPFGPPPVLRRLLAIGQTVAERLVRDHALEQARGWDSLELLRGLCRDEVAMIHRLAAESRRNGR